MWIPNENNGEICRVRMWIPNALQGEQTCNAGCGACLKSSLDFLDTMDCTDYLDSLRGTLAIGRPREFYLRLL